MIFDRIENIGSYKGISAKLANAFVFLEKDARGMREGETRELGGGLFARCLSYLPSPLEDGFMEAHRAFIDVMLMAKGSELIGYIPTSELKNITADYDNEKDSLLAREENITMLPFNQGGIAVFFPQDAHMPGVGDGREEKVVRIVVKVPV